MTLFLLLLFSYVIGGVPFGLLLGRAFADVDVREFGSGNIGATNVNRVLGRKLGAATLGCDILKGMLMVFLAKILLPGDLVAQVLVGCAAVVGHCFPLYLNFQGGKGVATLFGILIPLSFKTALVAFVVWFAAARLSKISSVGALSASVVIPLSILFFIQSWTVTLLFCALMALILYRHKENIERLRAGVES